jgi:hypothetical protein
MRQAGTSVINQESGVLLPVAKIAMREHAGLETGVGAQALIAVYHNRYTTCAFLHELYDQVARSVMDCLKSKFLFLVPSMIVSDCATHYSQSRKEYAADRS